MYVACVHIHVKPEHREAFLKITLDNARNTVREPGNLRFDVHQSLDDPNRFLLYEVYRSESGMKAHKETAHYARWAETVGPLLAEPRLGVKYTSRFPEDEQGWRG
jgi:quinol monooxygenase YgiN